MDMALCSFDPGRKVLEYAGANCPLYLVRNGEVLPFAPDKIRSAASSSVESPSRTTASDYCEGDMVYIFSDGYADQFGGPKGKKFLYRRFRELLVEISTHPTERQANASERCLQRSGEERTNRWTTSS
jgi:serine phosphatase RsbU (regulator of sigma subunit)